jgi:hypothetical protein
MSAAPPNVEEEDLGDSLAILVAASGLDLRNAKRATGGREARKKEQEGKGTGSPPRARPFPI